MNNTFQTIVLVTFGFIGIFAVLVFAGVIPIFSEQANFGGDVVFWGTISEDIMSPVVQNFNNENQNVMSLTYKYVDENNFEDILISALASGKGPDMIMLPQTLIIKQSDKIYPIPYENYSERDFKDTFIDEGEMFLSKQGILAFPMYVDPLVMYFNKDLFSTASVSTYPKTWNDFLNLTKILTHKDTKGNVFQSTVALGTFNNIDHAKDILSTFLLQVGDNIFDKVQNNNLSYDTFESKLGNLSGGAESTLRFYTEFANQARTSYSWNSSLPSSKQAFEQGILAVYFGRAGEYTGIKRNNPHLNFDVSIIPQRENIKTKTTFGDIKGVAILNSSKNISTAFQAAVQITSSNILGVITSGLSLPSARRDMLSDTPSDSAGAVFQSSALISKAWFDPDKNATEKIFKDMVESVLFGQRSDAESVEYARAKLSGFAK